MSILDKPLDKVLITDLQELRSHNVREGKEFDYKRLLSLSTDIEKREFLADVSSFANTTTGYLIFGMLEEDGIPTDVGPFTCENVDDLLASAESLMRDSISPRICGVQLKAIPFENKKIVLIARIPKSWSAPHRVTFRGHDKFYGRNSNGKYSLDVGELRSAFLLSESGPEKIKNFRIDRLLKIKSNLQLPTNLASGPSIALHLVPLISLSEPTLIDVKSISDDEFRKLSPMSNYNKRRFNFDGYLLADMDFKNDISISHTQLFRNGCIESVDTDMLSYGVRNNFGLRIAGQEVPTEIRDKLKTYLNFLRNQGIQAPIFAMVSLLGVKGFTMGVGNEYIGVTQHEIERDDLLLPEIIIEEYDSDVDMLIKPAIDSLWNACGWEESLNYNSAGRWVGWR